MRKLIGFISKLPFFQCSWRLTSSKHRLQGNLQHNTRRLIALHELMQILFKSSADDGIALTQRKADVYQESPARPYQLFPGVNKKAVLFISVKPELQMAKRNGSMRWVGSWVDGNGSMSWREMKRVILMKYFITYFPTIRANAYR